MPKPKAPHEQWMVGAKKHKKSSLEKAAKDFIEELSQACDDAWNVKPSWDTFGPADYAALNHLTAKVTVEVPGLPPVYVALPLSHTLNLTESEVQQVGAKVASHLPAYLKEAQEVKKQQTKNEFLAGKAFVSDLVAAIQGAETSLSKYDTIANLDAEPLTLETLKKAFAEVKMGYLLQQKAHQQQQQDLVKYHNEMTKYVSKDNFLAQMYGKNWATYTGGNAKTVGGEWSPTQSNTTLKFLAEHFNGISDKATCPECKENPYGAHVPKRALYDIIMHLNDNHKWTRERIADWLETLDIDTTMKTEEVNT